MSEPVVRIIVDKTPPKPRWYVNFADFANMVKAFIGSNYLSVAYAFFQSGLLLGIGGILFIAGLTDHCCHLIVKTKRHAIAKIQARKREEHARRTCNINNGTTPADSGMEDEDSESTEIRNECHTSDSYIQLKSKEEEMFRHMTYGDVGKMAYGVFGVAIVNFCIALTQFGFCVAYFIFIGNTVHSLFPIDLCHTDNVTGTRICTQFIHDAKNATHNDLVHSSHRHARDIKAVDISDWTSAFAHGNNSNLTTIGPSNMTTMIPSNITTMDPSNITTTMPSNVTEPIMYIQELVYYAPDLKILVAAPLPIFVIFALIRSVRYLGIISVIANFSILFGCVSVLGFLLEGFEVHATVDYANWEGFPVFFGMVTGAFEGIGLVIPIESSMVGNRHLFACFLHGAISFLLLVLAGFGVLGYLKFGKDVHQMLNTNIPAGNPLGMVVNVGICFGILLTFPLQIFPVIEILEKYLFTEGSICGPKAKTNNKIRQSGEEQERLLSDDDEEKETPFLDSIHIVHVPDSVPTWKRNFVRICVVLIAGGLAIMLKDNFAYVGAFVGAVGSSVLAFILPCLFHLKICWHDLNVFIRIKDILVIVIGIVASVVSVISVVQRIAENTDL